MSFIQGDGQAAQAAEKGPTSGAFYQRLQATDPKKLPRETKRLRLAIASATFTGEKASETRERVEEWVVCSSLGRGAPRICNMCLTP